LTGKREGEREWGEGRSAESFGAERIDPDARWFFFKDLLLRI
jgi:hypothetical protein